jgi:hypothetical protein
MRLVEAGVLFKGQAILLDGAALVPLPFQNISEIAVGQAERGSRCK